MSPSSDRGQVEPLAALVAVLAVGLGLSMYVGALDGYLAATGSDRDRASVAADRLVAELASFGVLEPFPAEETIDAAPTNHALNATLATADRRWSLGPAPPNRADRTGRTVSVREMPGRIRPGRLEVRVWPAE